MTNFSTKTKLIILILPLLLSAFVLSGYDFAQAAGCGTEYGSTGGFTQNPTTMAAGSTANVSVSMTNCGTLTWTAGNNFRLGSQNPANNSTWGLARVDLWQATSSTVAPGGSTTFNFTITAPSSAGSYNLQFQMLRENVVWFGDATANVVVTVTAPPVNGVCSTTHYNCSAGVLGANQEYSAQWNWWCNGTGGGSNILCIEYKPVNCVGSWGDTSTCSVSCGGGVYQQVYTVTTPAAYGGTACPYANGATQWGSTSCNTQSCAAMSGTLTPSAPSCVIASGASSCDINFSWTTTNPVGTSAITKPVNVTVASGNSGTNTPLAVGYNSETFYLYNNAVLLAQSTVTSSCASGTAWNGSTCAVVVSGVCGATHYDCTVGTSTNQYEDATSWTWACVP